MTSQRVKRHHDCAVEDCRVGLPRDILMCRPHWRMVPRPLRHDVTSAYRWASTLSTKPSTDPTRRQSVTDYLAARTAAVEYMKSVLCR